MGIFPVEFPSTTADSFESFQVLHYLAFIKEEDALIEAELLWFSGKAYDRTSFELISSLCRFIFDA